jgi:C-terminal processing protease CtpA/Prc
MRPRRLFPLALLLLAGCGGSEPTRSVPEAEMSAAARAYLDAALDIMQANSLHRARIEWPGLRARAYDTAGTAQTPAETYPAIRAALRDLGDRHSSFATPPASTGGGGTPPPAPPPPAGRSLEGGIAYVYMPAFVSPASTEHVDAYHAVLRDLDAASPCGWVVDVRLNPGGNMWPMLAGIGPVLGEGEVGRFVAPDGAVSRWWHRDGQAGFVPPGGTASVLARVSAAPYRLKRPMPPVAVLTGPVTASSGEAVVTAFRGRPDTRSFGRSTAGLSTANLAYRLSDGAVINLTVSTFADRTGRVYGESIAPDEVIPVSSTTRDPATDLTLRTAVQWLREQPPCRG